MRPVNLAPEGSRGQTGPTMDPIVSYGIVGALCVLLLMVVFTITQANKATTLQDQTAEVQAEASKYQTQAKPVEKFNDFAEAVDKRMLLIGGLAESRFPWHTALYNLAQAMPKDVTLDTITAKNAAPAPSGSPVAGTQATTTSPSEVEGATVEMTGCAAGWIQYARFTSRLKTMPGVLSVSVKNSNNDGSSDTPGQPAPNNGGGGGDTGGGDNPLRKINCGENPLSFTVGVAYRQLKIDLVGLPKIAAPAVAGGATGSTGATSATPAPGANGAPASATAPGAH